MKRGEYEIISLTRDLVPGAVGVLNFLWGDNYDLNLAVFRWKYDVHPFTDRPLGIVAVHKGKVVGFRGYFATRYEIHGKTDNMIVLCAGDTCVHQDHRRKGVSVLMGNLAMQAFENISDIFMNMTTTRASLPGYLKMGFLPLVEKFYISRYTLTGFLSYVLNYRKGSHFDKGRIACGSFDQILVSNRPDPSAMLSVITSVKKADHKIRLYQDRTFYSWRFNNPKKQYIFYYLNVDGVTHGYAVVGLSPNNRRGYILDYAGVDDSSVEHMLRHIISMRHVDILSIYHFCLSEERMGLFKKLGFKGRGLVRRIEAKMNGELPLLVRPIKKTYGAHDCLIHGLDIRKKDNWLIKGICSDDA
jgi:GNAT superfamily N-acetyltransferase